MLIRCTRIGTPTNKNPIVKAGYKNKVKTVFVSFLGKFANLVFLKRNFEMITSKMIIGYGTIESFIHQILFKFFIGIRHGFNPLTFFTGDSG